jgi:hypothetical protein
LFFFLLVPALTAESLSLFSIVMLRKLACTTSIRADAVAVTLNNCRLLSTQHDFAWAVSHRTQRLPFTTRTALLVSRRTAATSNATAEDAGRFASGAALTDAEIVAAADWKSPQHEERLGFRGGDSITEGRLKRHYYVLAKHFHPDTAAAGKEGQSDGGEAATGGPASAEAFHNIKEAYDAINATLKDGGSGWENRTGNTNSNGSARNGSSQDFTGGYTYSDEARRRSQMRLLGEGVMLFIAMTIMLIYIVSRHNKTRMQSRYLWHLVWIFFMIQLFPRLLAAAIVFAAHTVYLLDNTTLKEQAAVALIVERRKKECTVKLDGIRADAVPHVVVQVTTTADTDDALSASAGDAGKDGVKEQVSSTLTFDKGVTEFLLPVPPHSQAVYHIKAVDEQRKMVLVDRIISAVA